MFAPLVVSSVLGAASNGMSAIAASAQSASPAASTETSFAQFLDRIASETADSLKQGEASAISSVQGKASLQQAIDAVMAAERSLHTAIAIRDKAVGAYQEISRMTI
jgi:flagellar hook-basal body complex protein FliE